MDFTDLLKNMPMLKDMAAKASENMKTIKVTGEAGAGMVKVTINGANEIIDIEIDNELIKASEKETLIALLKGAHSVANKKVHEKVQEGLMNMAGQSFNPKKS